MKNIARLLACAALLLTACGEALDVDPELATQALSIEPVEIKGPAPTRRGIDVGWRCDLTCKGREVRIFVCAARDTAAQLVCEGKLDCVFQKVSRQEDYDVACN